MMNSTAVLTFGSSTFMFSRTRAATPFALADEAEEQVLRADVVVVEPLCLVLRECQDLAGTVGEFVEAIHSVERLFHTSVTDVPLQPC
jgi:hypothetical protein